MYHETATLQLFQILGLRFNQIPLAPISRVHGHIAPVEHLVLVAHRRCKHPIGT